MLMKNALDLLGARAWNNKNCSHAKAKVRSYFPKGYLSDNEAYCTKFCVVRELYGSNQSVTLFKCYEIVYMVEQMGISIVFILFGRRVFPFKNVHVETMWTQIW